jgi:hypothetical protein
MYVDGCRNSRRQEYDSKKAEKILKYKDLTTEIQRMWNVKTRYIRANAAASDMGTINSSDRIAVTLYCLGTWFV